MDERLTEVLPGIYRLVLSSNYNNINKINIFIIPGKNPERDRSLMVDVGFHDEDCMMQLNRAMKRLGIPYSRLDVFLTHKHQDHCGLAHTVERMGARIYMSPGEGRHHYDCLHYNEKSYQDQASVLKYAGITMDRTPKLWEMFTSAVKEDTLKEFSISQFPYLPVHTRDSFRYGEYALEAIPLKGHTFGQMGLVDKKSGVFFCADQIIRGIVPIVATSYKDEHLLRGYFKSLKNAKENLKNCRFFPAHNEMLQGEEVGRVIDHIVFAYLEKIQIIRQLVQHGRSPMTVVQIAMLAYGMQELPKTQEQFVFLKMITSKTFSCLEYLLDEDFVSREERNGVLYWNAG